VNAPVVRLRVSAAMDPHFDEVALRLLNATVVEKTPDPQSNSFIYQLAVPGAPEGAVEMDPVFAQSTDGLVTAFSLQSYGWRRADGSQI
jgi:hypothetical protein